MDNDNGTQTNLHWQTLLLNKQTRAAALNQKPACLWFTGLSGAGKSTIATILERRMFLADWHTYVLDGDNIRHGLSKDLGFSEADRIENIRRITEVARLFVDAGLVVIVSFISPFRAEREMARSRFAPDEFFEIFVDTPLDECEHRDPKGLYRKARRGELPNFTGIDSAYEPPSNPDIVIDTVTYGPEECVAQILSWFAVRCDVRLLIPGPHDCLVGTGHPDSQHQGTRIAPPTQTPHSSASPADHRGGL